MTLYYNLTFFTDWHCGSGLAAGADVDTLVVKDKNGLPFVPGKTLKGLIREAVEELISLKGDNSYALFLKTFGFFNDKDELIKGRAFFSNAELSEKERLSIVAKNLQPFLYRKLSSTAIGEDGIAKEHSLRKMEVAVPCTLEGFISGLPEDKDFTTLMKEGLLFIKRLGQNRNRGLGRCSFTVKSVENESPEI
ncbi:MAG: CRISPR-associated protein [Muribaculaceae bacterium]|nr:CRISPR-associated protein [Muribaculaceae bacterium]MDE6423998.1 CRISPR-associated protein [Muribaculaceae bacterium]